MRRIAGRVLRIGLLLGAGVLGAGFVSTHHPGPAAAASAPVTPTMARTIFLRDCAVCHGPDANGTQYGPTLQGVGRAAVDYWVSTGRMPLQVQGRPAKSPEDRAPPGQYVPDPNAAIHRRPPAYTPDEIRALVDYVASIAPGGPDIPAVNPQAGDLAAGGEVFRLQCAACHSWSGVGGALYQRAAPTLRRATPTQVAEAVRTGPDPMPAFGTAALTPRQLDDVVAYVGYLDHPDNRGGNPLWFIGPVAEGAIAIVLGMGLLLLVTRWIGTRS